MTAELSGTYRVVIAGLETSAEELRNDDRGQAAQRLAEIEEQIRLLNQAANEKEDEATREQQRQTDLLAGVLSSETDAHNKWLAVQDNINAVSAEISKVNTNQSELQVQIGTLKTALDASRRQLAEHQARLKENERRLNDTSVGSIFTSIASLGLDRAIVGIQTLAENDAQTIGHLQAELSRMLDQYRADGAESARDGRLLSGLQATRDGYERAIAGYKRQEADLAQVEKAYRAKVALLTNVALFYGKLAIMVDDVEHRVEDVVDIVAELNDTTPKITDYDTSGEVLVSLKQALVSFDELLA